MAKLKLYLHGENFMVLKSKKCHFLWIRKNGENKRFSFKDVCLENRKKKVILGITIGNKLTFDSPVKM